MAAYSKLPSKSNKTPGCPFKPIPEYATYGDERLNLARQLLQDEIDDCDDAERRNWLEYDMIQLQAERRRRNLPDPKIDTCLSVLQSSVLQVSHVSQVSQSIPLDLNVRVSMEEVSTTDSTVVQEEAWKKREYGKLSLGAFMRFALEADKEACRKKN